MIEKLRVMVVDAHQMVRHGLAILIEATPDLTCIGEASTPAEAISACQRLRPDVVLVDVAMAHNAEVSLIRTLADSGHAGHSTRVVVLTSIEDIHVVRAALADGAVAYLLKTAPVDDIVHAIRNASHRKYVLSSEITQLLIKVATEPSHRPGVAQLSERELEILRLIVKGLSNRHIATQLDMSYSSVRFHISTIFAKLGATNRIEAVSLAIKSHLV